MVHILGKKLKKKKPCPKAVIIYFLEKGKANSYAYSFEFPDEIVGVFTADSINPIDPKMYMVSPIIVKAKKISLKEIETLED